jgi:hypothetical protein
MKTSRSSTAKAPFAFAAGFLIYQAAVYVGGILAAIGVPQSYFSWFGRPYLELALAVLNTATFALPMVALFAGGTLATYTLLRKPTLGPFMLAIVSGVFSCFAFWTAMFVLQVTELPPGVQPYPVGALLKQVLLPSWWSVPNALAPWLGLAFAAWLIARSSRR